MDMLIKAYVFIGQGVLYVAYNRHLRIRCALLSTELTRAVCGINHFSRVPVNPSYDKERLNQSITFSPLFMFHFS